MDAVRHGAGGRTLELVRLDGREEGEGYEANGEELHLCGISTRCHQFCVRAVIQGLAS